LPSARRSNPQRRSATVLAAAVALAFAFAAAPAAAAQGDDMDRAKEAYSRGQELFDAGEITAASAAFRESLDAFPHYRTIFNIALCEEKLGNVAEAVAMYQRYVDWPAEVPNREEVAAKLAELRAQLPPEPVPEPDGDGQDADGSASAPDGSGATGGSSTSSSEEPGPDLIVPGWITMGIGAAGVITGGVLIGLAQSRSNQIANLEDVYYDPGEHDAMQDEGRRFEIGGWVAGGVGAAALATGLIMLLVSERSEEPPAGDGEGEGEPEAAPEPEVALGVGCGDAALCLSGGWRF
jgi:tetratricopeptide (TPR) repeat protein